MDEISTTREQRQDPPSALSAADLELQCAERLEQLGVRPGTSRRRLMAILRKQEGRRITVKSRGEHGRLLGHSASTSALVDRRPERRDILVLIADPRRSARGRHTLLHELSHLVVAPGGPSLTSRLRADSARGDAGQDEARQDEAVQPADARAADAQAEDARADDARFGLQYRCGCSDAEEREVEMTAHLLQRYMGSALLPDDEPAASGLGLVLARRGPAREPR
jgi:hypothetical protein